MSMIRNLLGRMARRLQPADPLWHVRRNTLEVRGLLNLQLAMGWERLPILDAPHLDEYEHVEDLNHRRRRDAEAILSACCNGRPKHILEIGTAHGRTTMLMSRNAPSATIHTVNIPPEQIAAGGHAITFAPGREEIGHVHRAAGCTNVRQVLANTADWSPDFGPIDVALIDGCHDSAFVYQDTKKVLARCRPGSVILWHDFAPALAHNFDWINSVCLGVERLYAEGLLVGRILHMQDSWVGLYRVPAAAGAIRHQPQPLAKAA